MTRKEDIIKQLKKIIDPHMGENIYDLGLVTNIVEGGGVVRLNFKPTSPFCPMTNYFENEIKANIRKIKGIKEIKIKVDI